MSEKYSPLNEGWVGKKQIDISKVKIDMSKIRPIERVIVPANAVVSTLRYYAFPVSFKVVLSYSYNDSVCYSRDTQI